MLAFLLLNLLIVYLVVQEKNGKFFRKKKRFVKFCPKVPLVPNGQEFRPECNFLIFAPKPAYSIFRQEYIVGIFEPKLADRIFRGPRKK